MIRDPQGRQNTVEVMMEDKGDNTYCCTYRPTQMGPHVVTVTFGGMGIPKSPFSVDVGPGELPLRWAAIPSEVPFNLILRAMTPLFRQPACPGRAGRRVAGCSRRG